MAIRSHSQICRCFPNSGVLSQSPSSVVAVVAAAAAAVVVVVVVAVLLTRILVFGGLYWGSPILGNRQMCPCIFLSIPVI